MFNRELKPKAKLKSKKYYRHSKFFGKLSRLFFYSIWGAIGIGGVGMIVSMIVVGVHFNNLGKNMGFNDYLKSPEYRQEVQMEISELEADEAYFDNIEYLTSEKHARTLYSEKAGVEEEEVRNIDKEQGKAFTTSIISGVSIMLSSFAFLGLWVGAQKLSDYEERKGNLCRREEREAED